MTFTQFLNILRARWKLSAAVFFTTVLTAVLLSLVLPKKYTATASVVVDVKPDPINGVMAGMANLALVATQVDIISSDRVARRVIKNLQLDQRPDIIANWKKSTDGKIAVEDWLGNILQAQLDVKPSRESNVIAIDYTAPDPEFAAAVANAFAKGYLDTLVELKVDPARQYSGFFDDRVKEARSDLESAQTRLSEYQRTNGILVDDQRLDVETQRLNELTSQLVLAQSLASDSANRNSQAAGNSDHMAEALQDPVLSSLKVDLGRAEASLKELSARLGSNHPQVQSAKASIAEIRARIDAETKRVAGSVGVSASINSAKVSDLKSQIEMQRAKVSKLNQERDGMAVLQRDVDNAQKTYDALVARRNQSNLESQSQMTNVSVLSPAAVPLVYSSPKIFRNIALAILVGGFVGILLAYLREIFDRRVRSTEDLVTALGVPTLGVMPRPAIKSRAATLMAQRVISGRLPPANGDKG